MKSFFRSPIYILFAATAVVLIANGSRQSFGLFLEPISTDLGWGVSEFAFAIAAQNLIMGVAAPFTGALADRYMRPTSVIALSAALYTAGLALISVSVTPETMFLSAGLIVGLGASGVGLTLPLGIVGRIAPEKSRTLWLGIVTAGGSAGQFTFGLTANGLIDGFGWAGGIIALAILVALAVPLAYSMRWAGESAFSKPDTETLGGALKKASSHRGYWLLVMGFFVCGFQVQFLGTHLPKYLTDSGAGAWLAATAISIIGLFNLFGTIAAGWAGGRWRKRSLLSQIYLARGLLFLVFLYVPVNEVTVISFSALLGLLWLSTVPLTSGIVAQVFGPRYMSTLFAIVFLSHQLGAFSGVFLGGLFYDMFGTYEAAWWLAIALSAAAALIHWCIDDRPLENPEASLSS
ncbi:MAG TPA: MFS transporter [Rhodospirillaceae bacterium]|nr:MFS transporter [Rhodospirillaceae bacterium]|tara:strand:+ start:552 stop:1766 length:1215 start_codon:yes stop_codon:yes gene_type:complete